jgi:hypothetical protein
MLQTVQPTTKERPLTQDGEKKVKLVYRGVPYTK